MLKEFTSLVNIKELKELLESNSLMFGYAYKLVDFQSNEVLYSSGWLDIFDINEKTFEKCSMCNYEFEDDFLNEDDIKVHCCDNGLVIAMSPIVIEDDTVAKLFIGQVLFEKNDSNVYGNVPVVNKDKFIADVKLLTRLITLEVQQEYSKKNLEELNIALLEAEKQRYNFLTFMSHELFTPLNGVMAFSEVLNKGYFGKLNNKQSEYISIINDNSKQLFMLLNDIIKINELKANLVNLHEDRFNFKGCLNDMSSLLYNLYNQKGVKLSIEYDSDYLEVKADRKNVSHILLNLLANALRASVKGNIVLVKVKQIEDNKLIITVKDSGKVISVDKAESIFNIINYDSYLADEDLYGKGIGLYLTKKLVELNNGEIGLDCNNQDGNTFWFTLPLDV
ncbi:MAG: ATP-binding protein [Cyanobacteriota bacterium]